MTEAVGAVVRRTGQAVLWGRRQAGAFGVLWRRSLQVRVTISTLALSSAVVFVLGMVLQYQITERLLDTKKIAATAVTRQAKQVVEKELQGVNPSADAVESRL